MFTWLTGSRAPRSKEYSWRFSFTAAPIAITLERSASRRSGVVSALTEVSSNGAVFPIQVKRQNFAVVEGISRRLWTRWAVVVRRLITGASALTVRQEPRSSLD